jgi:hypothetical protein
MIELVNQPVQTVSTNELQSELERVLRSYFGGPRSISRLERRTAAMCSSFALEELDLILDGETALSLMFKNLSRQALEEDARRVKPAFLHDALREIEVYQQVLEPHRMGTAGFYGTVVDPQAARYWLFVEKVAGKELYQVGDFAIWQQVAAYLAVMHTRFAAPKNMLLVDQMTHLLAYNANYFRLWLVRAQDFLQGGGQAPLPEVHSFLERLNEGYEQVIEQLLLLPRTLIHGEFYASNVLVQPSEDGLRVCPVDWEMAGVGPGLMDLAALTAGEWTEEQKRALALAYHAALPPDNIWFGRPEVMVSALDYCYLHIAMQWLGWAADWSPPPEHRRNWLNEAMRLAEKVGL